MDIYKKNKKCASLKVSTDKTSEIREYNQTVVVNDSSFNTNERQSLSRDVTEIISHQIEHQLVISELFSKPHPLHILRKKLKRMKQVYHVHTVVKNFFEKIKINNIIQQSKLSTKQEKNFRTTLEETTGSDQMILANSNESIIPTASQNLMTNIVNIKKEKNVCTYIREGNSSDQRNSVSSNELTLANEARHLMAKQNPNYIANNSNASIIRESPYFCIRKLPKIRNVLCNDDYDQTLQNNVIFICRICKNAPSSNIHTFALHMSDHSECNMHECIVCDATFDSIVLWAKHMIYHQQQID